MNAALVASMAGHLRVAPGAPLPHSLSSSRMDWAERLSAGQPLNALPGLMASLFSLCGNAHRVCAQLAIDAATTGQSAPNASAIAERLRLETAQEHIRRIGLDWPRLLSTRAAEAANAPAAIDTLTTCPALRHPSAHLWPALHDWLQQHWLHMDPAAWLQAWQADAGDWLLCWSQQHSGGLPRLLRDARHADTATRPLTAVAALRVHGSAESLHTLSDLLSGRPGFTQHPLWHAAVAHTGSWARLQTPAHQAALTPWALLGSRIAELVRLCLPDTAPGQGAQWLRWGALQTQPGVGLGWAEMARGLLVHQVTLSSDGATVQRCRVLAPTEWNFHPQGEVAQRLSALDALAPEVHQQVNLLMAAFDPCVPFELAPQTLPEVSHA